MTKTIWYFGALASAALALGATETAQSAEKRLKCVTGALMMKQLKERFDSDEIAVCEEVRQKLQKLNPKLDLCYREASVQLHNDERLIVDKELIVLNSKDVGLDVLDEVVPKGATNTYMTYAPYLLPSGEKVFHFVPRKSGRRLDDHLWLKGGFSF